MARNYGQSVGTVGRLPPTASKKGRVFSQAVNPIFESSSDLQYFASTDAEPMNMECGLWV